MCIRDRGWLCLFARDVLPGYYDQGKISFYADGPFRMNLAGVHFNNRNWPHILRAMRLWTTVTPVVYGHASTYSKDSDSDGLGGSDVPKYPVAEGDSRLMVLGTEELPGRGLIIVSGAAFMSNFEVQATISDSNAEKNYSNYNICENLARYLNPVTITEDVYKRQLLWSATPPPMC